MKNIKIYLIAMGFLALTSCDEWLDVNDDPTNPQTVTSEVVLPAMFAEMVRGEVFDSRFFGCYAQNWARITAGVTEDIHGTYYGTGTPDNIGEKWRQHYFGIGLNIDLIIDDATAKSRWWSVGVAYAIRAWSWQTSTDVYGEMILKQAWEPNRYVFDYDTQEEIYAEVVRLCDLALENLDKDDVTNSLAIGDLVYAGNRDKWKKFVYAIKARNAHHLSNKTSLYDADAVIGFVDLAMGSNADNFNVPHLGTNSGNASFWGPTRANLNNYRQTQFAVNMVNGAVGGVYPGIVDPRATLMFQATVGLPAEYKGLINGAGNPNPASGNNSIPTLYNKYIYRDNNTIPLFTYAEMQFIKAEAAFKKGDLTTALTAYKNGISAHMDYTGVTPANRDAYLLTTAVAQTTVDLDISDIMIQKYIAMYGHGILETWVDMRRHHYSPTVYTGLILPTPLATTNNGKPAYRALPRFNSEYMWNVTALERIGALATDYHTKEQWFTTPE